MNISRGGGSIVTALASVVTAVEAVETDVVAVKTSVDAQTPAIEIWRVYSNYGSPYLYELGTAGAGKVYWITIGYRYNNRQESYMKDNGTVLWYWTHEARQHQSKHCVFDPPIPFSTQLQVLIAASGHCTIGYKMD